MRKFIVAILLSTFQCYAQSLPPLKGTDLISGKTFEHNWKDSKKGSVLVFLSSSCPCSHAHIGHLIDLSKTYPDIQFIGIHSNANEAVFEAEKYFKSLNLPFPVIQDHSLEWANRLKANRTPHAFLLNPGTQLLYQGGVSSSSNPEKADSLYLNITLKKFLSGEKIETTNTRVLGCPIAR